MAFLGLRSKDAGLGSGSTVDLLVKALTGDPEREMALARGRSAMETDAYQRRLLAEQARAQQEETDARLGSTRPAAQLAYDNLPEPVPVAIPTPQPRPAGPQMIPMDALGGADVFDRPAPSVRFDEPVPVDAVGPPAIQTVPFLDTGEPAPVPDYLPDQPTATGDWLAPGTTPEPQPVPGDVVDTRPPVEDIEKLMAAGAWTADPMGQYGKGAGMVGTVYGGGTPEEQARNNLLYAGKTPGESGGDLAKVAETLRKEYVANPSVKNFEDAYATLQGVEQAAKDNTGASDVAFMYGVMKAFDPGVSVQEGDKANAQATMNIPARVALMYNNAVDGKTDMFTPEVRAEFIQAVRGQVQGRRAQAERWMENYKTKARQQNVPPEWVVFDIPEMGEAPDLSQQLPPNVTQDMVDAAMRLNPTWSRDEVIRAILLDMKQQQQQQPATGQ